MDYQKERQLLEKYKLGQATEQEKAIVEDWISYGLSPEYNITEQELESELSAIDKQLPLVPKTTKLWPGLARAAAILLILGAGYFYYTNKSAQVLPQTTAYYDDVNPGSFGATLTLSDGKHIRLADAANGELSNEAGILITKSADGKLIYKVNGNGAGANKHNTLSTAKGETYQVNLPDGSAVWLNAASSLTYSTSIHYDGVRRVELQGEAYFEIAKDKKRPFVVKTANQEVKVLGTQFNVSSYNDEPLTATTLLEGSVLVTANSGAAGQKIIKPGEQAVLNTGGLKISAVDTQEAVAWKNGKFIFQEEAIGSIMRKIARWYDVEVVYQVDLKDMTFSGSMSRFENISQVLRKIEMTDLVHFKVEGRRIVVIK